MRWKRCHCEWHHNRGTGCHVTTSYCNMWKIWIYMLGKNVKKTNIVALCENIFAIYVSVICNNYVHILRVLFLQLRNMIRNLIVWYEDSLNQIYIIFVHLSQFLMYRITIYNHGIYSIPIAYRVTLIKLCSSIGKNIRMFIMNKCVCQNSKELMTSYILNTIKYLLYSQQHRLQRIAMYHCEISLHFVMQLLCKIWAIFLSRYKKATLWTVNKITRWKVYLKHDWILVSYVSSSSSLFARIPWRWDSRTRSTYNWIFAIRQSTNQAVYSWYPH